jgi:hypothetical protein
MDEGSDKTCQRRSLVWISGAIIIYVCAGAEFKEEGLLFGGSVELARPWVLEWAGVVFFIFSLYRFTLTPPLKPVSLVAQSFWAHVGRDKRLERAIVNNIDHSKLEDYGLVDHGKEVSPAWEMPDYWKNERRRRDPPLAFENGQWIAGLVVRDKPAGAIQKSEVVVPWFAVIRSFCRAALKTLWIDNVVWDRLFPLVLAGVAAVLIMLARWPWLLAISGAG